MNVLFSSAQSLLCQLTCSVILWLLNESTIDRTMASCDIGVIQPYVTELGKVSKADMEELSVTATEGSPLWVIRIGSLGFL